VRVLVADPAGRQRRRAGTHGVALEHDDAARAPPREMVGGADAHDAGADDDDVGGYFHVTSTEPERWPHNLKRRRGATRLRRGASERWGPGGHSGPPMSSIPPDHLTQRGAKILPHAFEVRMDRRSEEHTSELQSRVDLVCRLLLEKK